jgi:hypothetical protein
MEVTAQLSSPRRRGPSIPEASRLKPKSRGVLGRPVKPGDDSCDIEAN